MSGLARLLLTRGIPIVRQRAAGVAGAGRAAGARRHRPHDDTCRPTSTASTRSSTPPPSRRTTSSWSRRAGAGLRVLHRSEALAAAMTGRQTIAVAGTHGKTTTTSMITLILQHAGLDPSFVIGGEISEVGSNAHHGTGELLRRRGRRERPVVPALPAARRDRHQHRRRPPQHLRRPGRAGGRRSSSSPAGRRRTASWSPAPTTRAPARLADALRGRGPARSTRTARRPTPTCG